MELNDEGEKIKQGVCKITHSEVIVMKHKTHGNNVARQRSWEIKRKWMA